MRGHRGLFISFEGTEGSGKTTQLRLLVDRLRQLGLSVAENREPGSTAAGAQIRRIFLDPSHTEITPMTELLLMFASRTQAAAEIIRPALERGAIVVSDRFTDSTLAYQGEAGGLGFEVVREVHQLTLGSLWPNLTLCLAIDVEAGLARAHERNLGKGGIMCETRIDWQPLEFHRRVSEGYRKIAALEPKRFRMVDAAGDVSTVAQRVWAEVEPLLSLLAK
jgi:dTMP kinase